MVTGCTGSDDGNTPIENLKPNYNIVGDNGIKRVFKIPVGDIPEGEIDDYVRKVAEKFKKIYVNTNAGIQPDLDCGIYLNDNEIFLPTNIENKMKNKMPEQPNLQKIHDAILPQGK